MKVASAKIFLAISIGLLSADTAIAQPQSRPKPQESIPASAVSNSQDSLKVIVRDEVERLKKENEKPLELYIQSKVNEEMKAWIGYASLFAVPLGGFGIWLLATKWKKQFEEEYLEAIKKEVDKRIAVLDNHVTNAKQKNDELSDLLNGYLAKVSISNIPSDLKEQPDELGNQRESFISRLRRQADNLLSERLRLSFEPGQTASSQLQRQLRELLAEFKNLPENFELTSSDHVRKGDLSYFANNYDFAGDAYKKAIKINPDDDSAYYGMGNSLKKLEKYEEAERFYREAIRINLRNYLARINLGMAVSRLKRYEEAIDCVDEAIKIKPDYYRPWYNKACYLARLNKLDQSVEALRKAISLEAGLCRGLAKLDADFNSIRGDERFLKLLES